MKLSGEEDQVEEEETYLFSAYLFSIVWFILHKHLFLSKARGIFYKINYSTSFLYKK